MKGKLGYFNKITLLEPQPQRTTSLSQIIRKDNLIICAVVNKRRYEAFEIRIF